MMLLPGPPEALETGPPSQELVTAMRQYDQDMTKAGVLLAEEASTPAPKARASACLAANG